MLVHQHETATISTATRVRQWVNLVEIVSGFCIDMYRVTVIPTRLYDDQYNAPSVMVLKTEQEGHLPAKTEQIYESAEYLNKFSNLGFGYE